MSTVASDLLHEVLDQRVARGSRTAARLTLYGAGSQGSHGNRRVLELPRMRCLSSTVSCIIEPSLLRMPYVSVDSAPSKRLRGTPEALVVAQSQATCPLPKLFLSLWRCSQNIWRPERGGRDSEGIWRIVVTVKRDPKITAGAARTEQSARFLVQARHDLRGALAAAKPGGQAEGSPSP